MTVVPASPVALVTGAASGIGRGIVGRVAQTPGASVVVLDRDADGAECAAHEIRAAGGQARAALIAMTQQFAIEVAEAGVTVDAVAPGPIEPPLARQLLAVGTQSACAEKVPMRRFGTPEDIADAVAHLASPGAGYVTGHTLAVDGGFLAGGVFVRHLFDPPTPDAT